jgi:putative ABC transport system substrate-binding protein
MCAAPSAALAEETRSRTARSRRNFLCNSLALISLGLLAGCRDVLPLSAKMPRIGYLAGETADAAQPLTEATLQGLRDLGYVVGQNVTIDYRFTEGRPERATELVAELIALSPDVLLVFGTSQALAAKQATATIPIVIHAGDPVISGLVTSLSRPGGNVTGLSITPLGLYSKQLDLLKEAFPTIARPAYLSTVDPPSGLVKVMLDEAPSLGVHVKLVVARGPDDLPNAFAAAVAGQSDALIVPDDPWIFTYRAQPIAFAAQQRLPAIYGRREYVDDGGLMSYGQNILSSRRRVAVYVDKILRGANPADLPIEQPTTFDLALNLKTAQAAGLTVSQSVMSQVTDFIQ